MDVDSQSMSSHMGDELEHHTEQMLSDVGGAIGARPVLMGNLY